jgi:hypothetical protein
MSEQQSDREKRVTKKPIGGKSPQASQPSTQSKASSPMIKFNDALRKILSVPKKNLKDK